MDFCANIVSTCIYVCSSFVTQTNIVSMLTAAPLIIPRDKDLTLSLSLNRLRMKSVVYTVG